MPIAPRGFRLLGHVGRWLAFFRRFFPLAGPYWGSEDKWRIRAMSGLLLILTVLQIVIATSINLWIENLFNALENRDMRRFLLLIGAAAAIIAANIAVTISHLKVKRWIQIGWREWLTRRLVGEWMTDGRHFKVTLHGGEHSNPDGRIAEDIRFAAETAIELGHSLLYAGLILISFTAILWGLSGAPRLTVGDLSFGVPGHLVWIALVYALIGTFVALRLGQPLIRAQNLRQTGEANFRFRLAHVRQNSLLVALLGGEPNERQGLRMRFRSAVRAWNLQTRALVGLFYFSSAWWVLSQVFPILIAAPRYLAGAITLGVLMQTAQAFQQMVGALSWPVDNVGRVADWRASVERVLGLHDALEATRHGHGSETTIAIERRAERAIVFDRLALTEPDGAAIMPPLSAELAPGGRLLLTANPTAGFRLFKSLAELWPWGQGRLALPEGESLFLVSHRPYLPLGSLAAALTYPQNPRSVSTDALADALRAVGLDRLIGELDRPGPWSEILTDEEQHRLSFARIVLFRPKWIVFFETFDELASETRSEMLKLLDRDCADAAVLIIAQSNDFDGFSGARIGV